MTASKVEIEATKDINGLGSESSSWPCGCQVGNNWGFKVRIEILTATTLPWIPFARKGVIQKNQD